jgi:uncharacterized protein
VLILLPPSESKANRRRGRPADPSTWSFPELGPTRARVADALAQVSRSPEAPALLGVSPGLLGEVARNLVPDTAPGTPASTAPCTRRRQKPSTRCNVWVGL